MTDSKGNSGERRGQPAAVSAVPQEQARDDKNGVGSLARLNVSAEAIRAIGVMTSVTDRILFSSSPNDFKESTHINVRPPIYWLRLFAAQGFAPDLGYDATFILPHTIVLERVDGTPAERDLAACAELVRTRILLAERDQKNRELEAERDQKNRELEAERTRSAEKLRADRDRVNYDEAQLIAAISELEAEL